MSISTGLMPKKGLMAIPGTISASGSEGFGAMQMPPVSEVRVKDSKEYMNPAINLNKILKIYFSTTGLPNKFILIEN